MKRFLKLNYVLEFCEQHKKLEPSFSLQIGELSELIRAKSKYSKKLLSTTDFTVTSQNSR